MSPAFDPQTGRMLLTPPALGALIETARTRELVQAPGTQEVIDLGIVEALVQESCRPLQDAMQAWEEPDLVELDLAYEGRSAHVWVTRSSGVLVLPESDGEHEVRVYPMTHLPLPLARLVEVRPLARRHEPRPLDSFADVHRHWVLTSRWSAEGRTGGQALEVIDSGDAWWEVHRGDDGAWCWPTDGAAILARLTHMLMRRDLTGL